MTLFDNLEPNWIKMPIKLMDLIANWRRHVMKRNKLQPEIALYPNASKNSSLRLLIRKAKALEFLNNYNKKLFKPVTFRRHLPHKQLTRIWKSRISENRNNNNRISWEKRPADCRICSEKLNVCRVNWRQSEVKANRHLANLWKLR